MAPLSEPVLTAFRRPRSVAVVGASPADAKVGSRILANLLGGRYAGEVWPVNPGHAAIHGRTCYPSLRDIPEVPELVVLAVPAKEVPGVLREAAELGVRAAVIASSGFAETGDAGSRLQAEMAEVVGPGRVRVVGPNCLGVLDAHSGVNTFFVPADGLDRPRPGPAAILSQSGAFALALVERLSREGPGVSMALSFGNRADVGETEALEELADDDSVGVVALVIESIRDGARFLEAASRCARRKPIVALKCGRGGQGSAAVRSHTGALAGRAAVYGAAFRKAGVVEASGLDDLIDATKALALQPPAAGRRLLLVTNGGGLGAACADAAEEAGLRTDPLPAAAADRLRGRLPAFASVRNPLDLTAAAGDDAFGAALEECLAAPDAAYDAAVVVCLGSAPALTAGVARRIGDAAKRSGRPVVAMHVGGARGRTTGDALEASGIPVFPTPERAIGAVRALVRRGEALARLGRASTGSPPPRRLDGDARGRPAIEARAFLEARGVRFPAGAEAGSPEDAARAARELRGPYVLKVLSPDGIHKTEFGGVVTGLATPPDVLAAAREMDARFASRFPEVRRSGFRVEEQAPPPLAEVVVGGLRDATFGPAVAFGAGGVLVELLEDTSWRLAPLDDEEARQAIRSIRTFPALDGWRGRPRADVAALAAVLRAVGDLLASDPRISEIDLNPVLAYEHGAIAVDARILE